MRSLRRSRYLPAIVTALAAHALATIAVAGPSKPVNASKPHPLAGKMYSVAAGQTAAVFAPMARDELLKRLKAADVVLLGEIHDNAEHHRLRAQMLTDLRRATVFEHIAVDRQQAIDGVNATSAGAAPEPDAFFAAIGWEKSGWSKYPNKLLFETALKLRLPIYAGDVTRALILNAAKEKQEALPEIERSRLKLDQPLDPKSDADLLAELELSHCGAMPKEALAGMAFAQRYRDAHLADVVLKAAERHGSAVLLAGNGHVRNDRGAPWYIRRRAPDMKIATVTFVEVDGGKTVAADYALAGADASTTDFVVFTAAWDRPDPCEAFRKSGAN